MGNVLPYQTWYWQKGQTYTLTPGDHTITVDVREDGAMLDTILLTTNTNYVQDLLWYEAESGTMTSPIQASACTGASNGQCAKVPDGQGNNVGKSSVTMTVYDGGIFISERYARFHCKSFFNFRYALGDMPFILLNTRPKCVVLVKPV